MATDPTIRDSLKATAANAVTRNAEIGARIVEKKVAMLEFDLSGDTIALNAYVDLIPASDNPNGLILQWVSAIVTEVIASDSADGVVTIRSTESDAIDTLTANDADAVGDWVDAGADTKWWARTDGTDYSDQHVAAGVGVEAALTTLAEDAGTVTGKILVMVEFFQVPSKE